MTPDERTSIVSALHQMELALTERLARLEERVEGQSDLRKQIDELRLSTETELEKIREHSNIEIMKVRDRQNMHLVGFVILAIIALGDGALRIVTLV